MMGLRYGTVRTYRWLQHRRESKMRIDGNVKNPVSCPECGGTVTRTYDDSHEVVCATCGVVVGEATPPPSPEEYLGRGMTHSLLPDRNLGSDEPKYLPTLRRAGVIRRLTPSHTRGRDPHFWLPGFVKLSRLCQQAGLDVATTDLLGRRLRRKLKERYMPPPAEVEALADEVWGEYISSRGKA